MLPPGLFVQVSPLFAPAVRLERTTYGFEVRRSIH